MHNQILVPSCVNQGLCQMPESIRTRGIECGNGCIQSQIYPKKIKTQVWN